MKAPRLLRLRRWKFELCLAQENGAVCYVRLLIKPSIKSASCGNYSSPREYNRPEARHERLLVPSMRTSNRVYICEEHPRELAESFFAVCWDIYIYIYLLFQMEALKSAFATRLLGLSAGKICSWRLLLSVYVRYALHFRVDRRTWRQITLPMSNRYHVNATLHNLFRHQETFASSSNHTPNLFCILHVSRESYFYIFFNSTFCSS